MNAVLIKGLDYIITHRVVRLLALLVPGLMVIGYEVPGYLAYGIGITWGGLLAIALSFNHMLEDLIGENDF